MSKAVLISIRPEWVEKILKGEKTLEVRKTRPKLETPFRCYIYCTKGWLDHPIGNLRGMCVVGEFVCDDITEATKGENCDILCAKGCMSLGQIVAYGGNKKLYGWHITDLQIYDIPKPLNRFKPWNRECKYNNLGFAIPKCDTCHDCTVEKPPQSWCYVEAME